MVVIILLCITAFLLFMLTQIKRPANYPPGPNWLPFIGNIKLVKKLSVECGGLYLALSKLAKEYKTNVLGLKLDNYVVVVFSYETVHTVLTSEDFEGRPDNFFIRLRCFGKRRGVTCLDGPMWSYQRAFVMRHLRNLGYGKTSMKHMIQNELTDILQIIENDPNAVSLEPVVATSVINVIWTMVTGQRISRDNPRLSRFLSLMNERAKVFDMAGGILNQLPFLRFIMPERTGYNLILKVNQEMKEFFRGTIQEHKDTWCEGMQDDLIYAYITEMKQNKSLTDDQLIMVCLDLIIAGSTTTSNTLNFMILLMILHPQVQEKAAQELEKVLQPDETLTYAHRLRLPYIEAIILETERLYPAAPVIGPRRSFRDTTLEGFAIPKNCTILISVHSVHHDEEYWKDPEVFRPERFLDSEGNFVASDRVITFGLGRRRCLGELLARECIFSFFAGILRNYKLCPVPGKEPKSVKPSSGLTMAPQKYETRLVRRQNSTIL